MIFDKTPPFSSSSMTVTRTYRLRATTRLVKKALNIVAVNTVEPFGVNVREVLLETSIK